MTSSHDHEDVTWTAADDSGWAHNQREAVSRWWVRNARSSAQALRPWRERECLSLRPQCALPPGTQWKKKSLAGNININSPGGGQGQFFALKRSNAPLPQLGTAPAVPTNSHLTAHAWGQRMHTLVPSCRCPASLKFPTPWLAAHCGQCQGWPRGQPYSRAT